MTDPDDVNRSNSCFARPGVLSAFVDDVASMGVASRDVVLSERLMFPRRKVLHHACTDI